MSKGIIYVKSYDFALKIVKLSRKLNQEQKEFVLSKQLIRSGTAVGALASEAQHGQSKKDFLHKMNIALKEANETVYWLRLLKDSAYISQNDFDQIYPDSVALVKILSSIVKTTKQSLVDS